MMRELKKYELKLLSEGNRSEFAHLFLEFYPEIAEENGFDYDRAINAYRVFIDYSDHLYTFWGKTEKFFFDEKMQFRGTKVL